MKHGMSISLSDEDLDKLSYISGCLGYINTTGGVTGIIRICIQKAYAHQIEIEEQKKERENNKIKRDIPEPCIPIGGISQGEKISMDQRKRKW